MLSKTLITLLSLTIVADTASDIFLKKWAMSGIKSSILLGLLLLCITGVLWGISLKYAPLSKSVVVYNVANVILAVIAGIVIFKENLTVINVFGILFGILSIVLLSYKIYIIHMFSI